MYVAALKLNRAETMEAVCIANIGDFWILRRGHKTAPYGKWYARLVNAAEQVKKTKYTA